MRSPLAWRSRLRLHWSTGSMPTSSRFRMSFRRGSWQFHPCHRGVFGGVAGDVIPGLEILSSTPWSTISTPTSSRFRISFRRGSWQFHPCHREVFEGSCRSCHPWPGDPDWHSMVCELDADLGPIPNKFSSRLLAIPSVPSWSTWRILPVMSSLAWRSRLALHWSTSSMPTSRFFVAVDGNSIQAIVTYREDIADDVPS